MKPLLPERLLKLRKENKKTQQQIADFLGITRPAYTAYERGNRHPHYEMLQKLADFYGVTIDYLLGRTDDPEPNEEEFNSLAEINRMVKEYGIESFGFFDIEQWKQLSREDVEEIRKHFEWVAHKAKERNESDFDD
ncbi:helix-turn-helix domain-containing protein [Pseudobacillus badius]|uniref:helix-turn-helix domain-containing protein n=1 Tax=Bacillus badius TaxID=1455 RepID=UPI003D817C58